jgi:hypothetical protein
MPTSESLKKLSLNDIAIMSSLGHSFKSNLGKYVQIDPFTVPDPFDEKDDYNYSIIVDREEPNRIICTDSFDEKFFSSCFMEQYFG